MTKIEVDADAIREQLKKLPAADGMGTYAGVRRAIETLLDPPAPALRFATVRHTCWDGSPFEALVPATVKIGDVTRLIYPKAHHFYGETGPTVKVIGFVDSFLRTTT